MSAKKIRSVLIANRGEIAVRLIRTFRALGVRTVAVYSEADARSLPVGLADEAELLGPPPATESYLHIDRVLSSARKRRVDAVHPGYGFLSEREAFARAVESAGLAFLGPAPEQIALLGDKLAARKLMDEAGIGPVPGTREPVADPAAARRAAGEVGYPLLLKAAAGGGGKGIRIVRSAAELESAFRLASSEAQSSFGSPLLFAERYAEGARHVEIQILGDGHGGAFLFQERDCSIQRRLQKLVEESPSPAVSAGIRAKLLAAALSLVETTRYRGPGTLEFLLTPAGELHFLEVNTRIQVEHPVTEMVTGVDLVAEQLRVAEGARLPSKLDEALVPAAGAAIELRVNAEDPLEDFRPSVGRVTGFHLPHGPDLRIDSALLPDMEVSPYYDPLLAKVIARGRDREAALRRLGAALDEMTISGLSTTIPVGRALLDDASFQRGEYDCQFLARRLADPRFLRASPKDDDEAKALAAGLALLRHHRARRMRTSMAPRGDAEISAWRRRLIDEPGDVEVR